MGALPVVDARRHHHHMLRRCASLRLHPSTYFDASTPRSRRNLGAVVFLRLALGLPDCDLPGPLCPGWPHRQGHPPRTRPAALPNYGSLDRSRCRTRRIPDRDTSRCVGRSLDLSRSYGQISHERPYPARTDGARTNAINRRVLKDLGLQANGASEIDLGKAQMLHQGVRSDYWAFNFGFQIGHGVGMIPGSASSPECRACTRKESRPKQQ